MELQVVIGIGWMTGHIVLNPIPYLNGIELSFITILSVSEAMLASEVTRPGGLNVDRLTHYSFSTKKRSNPKLSITEASTLTAR
ncbi:hypothetical protein D3C71_1893020 [compost metagenome]